MDNNKVVISLSGGLDSTCLLAKYIDVGCSVFPVIFTYGSKHNKYENESAKKICEYYNLKYELFDLTNIIGTKFKSNLLISGADIPEGHYCDESMSQTVVPSRNIIFLSILSGYACSIEADKIAIGIHAGDHNIYFDCRPEFFKAMDTAIYLGTGRAVQIEAPFVNISKPEIVKTSQFYDIPVPFHLTRTCYKDQPIACGKCGSCVERLEAFSFNSIDDPIEYEDRNSWKFIAVKPL